MIKKKRDVVLSQDYVDLRHEAKVGFGEENDCSVKALSILTELPYGEVHAAFLEAGRQKGKGTPHEVTEKAIDLLGYKMIPYFYNKPTIISKYRRPWNGRYENLTTHHPNLFPEGWHDLPPLLVETRGHHAAFKNGQMHDWTAQRSKRIIDLHRIVKKSDIPLM